MTQNLPHKDEGHMNLIRGQSHRSYMVLGSKGWWDKVGKTGKTGRMGGMGRMGRMGRTGRMGKEGSIAQLGLLGKSRRMDWRGRLGSRMAGDIRMLWQPAVKVNGHIYGCEELGGLLGFSKLLLYVESGSRNLMTRVGSYFLAVPLGYA